MSRRDWWDFEDESEWGDSEDEVHIVAMLPRRASQSSRQLPGEHPPPSAHNIWNTVELVDFICTHLDKRSLGALARTCRRIQPSAHRHLYRELDSLSLESFLSLFAMESTHPYAMSEERFTEYAKFVRSLDLQIHGAPTDTLTQNIPVVIAKGISSPMFPSLQTISAIVDDDGALVTILLLLMGYLPHLNTVTLTVRTFRNRLSHHSFGQHELAIFLDSLPRRCPNLKRLSLHVSGGQCPSISGVLSQALDKLQHLEYLSLKNANVGPETLFSLSQHGSLTSLSLQHDSGFVGSLGSEIERSDLGGLQLRTLELGMRMSGISAVLRAFSDSLEELTIRASTTSGSGSYTRALPGALSTFTRLTRLDLQFVNSNGSSHGGVLTSMCSLLKPISTFRDLEVLRISGEYDVGPPEDKDLECVAGSCRQLKSLQLRWRQSKQGPTLQSLYFLGQQCPHLSIIELSQVRSNDKEFTHRRGTMREHGLSLIILNPVSLQSRTLAALLAGRWPSVKIRAGTSSYTDDVLKGLQAIREYQTGQAPGVTVFKVDADSKLRDWD